MNKFIFIASSLISVAAPALAQTLPLSQSPTFQTKADIANPTFTGDVKVSGQTLRVSGAANNEGSVVLESSHSQPQTGYVSFWQPNQGSRVGYVGFGTSDGINVATDMGSIYLTPAGAPNPMIVGKDANNKLQVVINNLPTSCTGELVGTLYASGHNVLIC